MNTLRTENLYFANIFKENKLINCILNKGSIPYIDNKMKIFDESHLQTVAGKFMKAIISFNIRFKHVSDCYKIYKEEEFTCSENQLEEFTNKLNSLQFLEFDEKGVISNIFKLKKDLEW